MNERRARQQLLRKYLIKMDLGDPKAEVMVDKIAKTMNDEDGRTRNDKRSKPVNVIHSDGRIETFKTRKDAAEKYDIRKNTLATYINKKTEHPKTGMRFENAERTEINDNRI